MNNDATSSLRALVEARLNIHWPRWSRAHPHLAEAIDRTQLVNTTVQRLRDDPEFRAAMREADLDAAKLAVASTLIAIAERWLIRLLGI